MTTSLDNIERQLTEAEDRAIVSTDAIAEMTHDIAIIRKTLANEQRRVQRRMTSLEETMEMQRNINPVGFVGFLTFLFLCLTLQIRMTLTIISSPQTSVAITVHIVAVLFVISCMIFTVIALLNIHSCGPTYARYKKQAKVKKHLDATARRVNDAQKRIERLAVKKRPRRKTYQNTPFWKEVADARYLDDAHVDETLDIARDAMRLACHTQDASDNARLENMTKQAMCVRETRIQTMFDESTENLHG
jgi:hypothetical protein